MMAVGAAEEPKGVPDASGKYTLYLDESGDHGLLTVNPQYSVLALCGIAIEDDYYHGTLLPRVDQFKVNEIGSAAVQLHYRALAQRAGPFKFLSAPERAWRFEQALAHLLCDLDITVFCAVIDKKEYLARYGPTRPVDRYLPTNLYLMALDFVLERFVRFLEECAARSVAQGIRIAGKVIAEERGRHEDAQVAAEYAELRRLGTQFVSGERFRRVLQEDLRFARKSERISGLEFADVCAAPIATQVLKPGTPSLLWEALRTKIWVGDGEGRGNVGLKRFPRSASADPLFAALGNSGQRGQRSPASGAINSQTALKRKSPGDP